MGLFDIFKVGEFKAEIEQLKRSNEAANKKLDELGASDYFKVKEMTATLQSDMKEENQKRNRN